MKKQQENLTSDKANSLVDPKIEAIKEIIFGDNIKEYESEFKKLSDIIDKQRQELEGKLNNFKQETNDMLAQASKEFDTRLNELKKDFANEIDNLAKSKLDRKTFGHALKNLGEDISS